MIRHGKEGCVMDHNMFVMSILAGVISNLICKLLDRHD